MRHREPAICLRCIDYSETSQVVCFVTRGCGLVRLLAKGTKRAKSKSGGAIDLFSEGELVFTTGRGEALGTLIEFTETVSHAPLRTRAVPLNASLYMIELVGEMLAEDDPHPEVFELLHNALLRLGETGAPAAAVLAYFQWRLLRHVGLLGDLKACVACGSAVSARGRAGRDVYFSSAAGGLLCEVCEAAVVEKFRLPPAALAGLAAMTAAQAGKRVNLPDKQADAVNRMLAYHIAQQLGKEPKMASCAIGREKAPDIRKAKPAR